MLNPLGTPFNNPGGLIYKFEINGNCGDAYFQNHCELWQSTDLDGSQQFFNFDDIKPGDFGANVISLRVYDNDAHACLIVHNDMNEENNRLNPETLAGDGTAGPGPTSGELSQFIEIFAWNDDNDGVFEPLSGETPLYQGPIDTELIQLSLIGVGPTSYVGLAWCAGDQTVNLINGPISCNGATMTNVAQTDVFTASLTAYAEQQRNNPNFSCASVVLPPQ